MVPRILVLLASYNGARWLREQIDSILAQTGVAVEILVGDDASRDATASLLREGWPNEARLRCRLWEQSSGSAGASFRRLFREADSEGYDFVALADQDDIWHPDKLLRAVAALQQHDAHAYSAAAQAFWPDGRRKLLTQCPHERAADFLFEGAGQGCTFVLRQPFFVRVRRFCIEHKDPAEAFHYHDWLIYLLARAWDARWYFDQAPTIAYRQHDGNEIGSRGSLPGVRRRVKQIRNGWYLSQVAAAIRLHQAARPGDPVIKQASHILSQGDSAARRIRLAAFLIRHGRRRLAERVFLVFMILSGWL
jgi:rhamnosyltransferase